VKNQLPSAWNIITMLFGSSKRMLHEEPFPKPTGQKRGIIMTVIDKSLCCLMWSVLGPALAVMIVLVVIYLLIIGSPFFIAWLFDKEKIKEWRTKTNQTK
jgi:hypothetical protein